MITIIATIKNDRVRARIERPDQPQPEFLAFESEAEFNRAMYIKNRAYIIEKLRSWMKGRMFGLKVTEQPERSMEAARLLTLLNYYHQATLPAVCRVVNDHAAAIEALAPSQRSTQYQHYQKVIRPILDYCRKEREVVNG